MGIENSVIGEYFLYALLFISIGIFMYILQKEQLPSDIKEDNSSKEKLSHNDTEPKTSQEHIIPKSIPTKLSSLDVYRNDMPSLDEVKPYFFEYFKGQKLLIVEDNLINQKILLNVLKNINTPIDVVDNGQEAVKKVFEEKHHYDMILMDISMPVMGGIDATRYIRSDSKYVDIPIVTVTAFTSGLEIGEMFDAGANAFLTKPLDIYKLFTVMLIFLDNKKSDLSIEKEFEILGIDWLQMQNTENIHGMISEFIDKFSSLEDKIPMWIDDNNFVYAQKALEKLEMMLEMIGAIGMQKFIRAMQNAIIKTEDIQYYKVLFKATYKSLINTYKKYLNSI